MNYNLPKSENARQPKCPPEKEAVEKDQADAILNAIKTADFTPMSEEEKMIV